MTERPACTTCQEALWTDIEIDCGLCNRCQDRMIDRANRRAEWDYYHPGEPMPKSEQ